MRLVDADALLTKAKDMLITDGKGNCAKYRCIDAYHVQAAPTIEQPRIVRCKDCTWRETNGADSPKWLPCMDHRYNDEFFCAGGTPK